MSTVTWTWSDGRRVISIRIGSNWINGLFVEEEVLRNIEEERRITILIRK